MAPRDLKIALRQQWESSFNQFHRYEYNGNIISYRNNKTPQYIDGNRFLSHPEKQYSPEYWRKSFTEIKIISNNLSGISSVDLKALKDNLKRMIEDIYMRSLTFRRVASWAEDIGFIKSSHKFPIEFNFDQSSQPPPSGDRDKRGSHMEPRNEEKRFWESAAIKNWESITKHKSRKIIVFSKSIDTRYHSAKFTEGRDPLAFEPNPTQNWQQNHWVQSDIMQVYTHEMMHALTIAGDPPRWPDALKTQKTGAERIGPNQLLVNAVYRELGVPNKFRGDYFLSLRPQRGHSVDELHSTVSAFMQHEYG